MLDREIRDYCQKTGESELSVRRRLAQGEPLQYILGEWEFYGLPFKVGPGVFIPQPDTELLVERALPLLTEKSRVLDVCSGSGCIAVAIAKNSRARVTAVEKYEAALQYLRRNIALNGVPVDVIQGDVLLPPVLDGPFDVLVANPPYIAPKERGELPADVLAEPPEALFAEQDGLAYYYALREWLPLCREGGHFLFEIGYRQAQAVKKIFAEFQPRILQDYGGNDRVICGTIPLIK